MPDRGPTWTEEHRHACEVRWVCLLSKEARDRYFYGDESRRIKRALIEAAKAWWPHRHTRLKPHLPEKDVGDAGATECTSEVNRCELSGAPGDGSFLSDLHEGPLRRVDTVVSGGAA